jgi:hypothetical protein
MKKGQNKVRLDQRVEHTEPGAASRAFPKAALWSGRKPPVSKDEKELLFSFRHRKPTPP